MAPDQFNAIDALSRKLRKAVNRGVAEPMSGWRGWSLTRVLARLEDLETQPGRLRRYHKKYLLRRAAFSDGESYARDAQLVEAFAIRPMMKEQGFPTHRSGGVCSSATGLGEGAHP